MAWLAPVLSLCRRQCVPACRRARHYSLRSVLSRFGAPVPPTAPAEPGPAAEWHGFARPDEYAWMQDPRRAACLREYLDAERRYADRAMRPTLRLQRALQKEMSRATEVDRPPPPVETRSGDHVYYVRSGADEAQLYCRRPVSGPGGEQVLLDAAAFAEAHGHDLQTLLVSDDHSAIGCLATRRDGAHAGTESGSLFLFSLSEDGATELQQTLEGVFSFVFGPGNTVYYTVLNGKLRAHKVRCHRAGQPQSQDVDIYTERDDECFVDITRTKDKRFHVVNSSTLDSSEVRVFSADGAAPPGLQLLRPRQRGVEYFVDHHGNEFVILTNSPPDDSARAPVACPLPFRLVRAPSSRPASESWTDMLHMPDGQRIEDVEIFRDYIMVSAKRHGRPEVIIHNRSSRENSRLPLPHSSGCVVRPEPNPQFDTSVVRLALSTPVHMGTVLEYDMGTLRQTRSWGATSLRIDAASYVVRHERVPVAQLQVPLTLVHHESVDLSTAPPTLVRVYGAYGVSLEPEFRLEDVPLLRRGWAIALAHVRGGGELGREWYAAGRGRNKINTVTDLLSCARLLLDRGWAAPERLAVTGVSAGGLAAGAALNMAPECFRAATLHVPFLDPLTAMLSPDLPLTGVETAEWGDPRASAADYAAIRAYAPYDCIVGPAATARRPAVLVTAGGRDQRVAAWQPAKWVARMRSRGGYSTPGARLVFVPRMDEGHFHSDGAGSIGAHSLRNAFLIAEVAAREGR
ncbi:hypothetical protein H4R18_001803 [Coemansia javaensis]|uniref:Prolyl endopeptidase n=1 Tax=Coemansia javaensis TaxID=2761396 RepID=A0A9W8HDX4_9FUNG|nr:hypothetical protein H4R18_001803 [Coemansia javaensis]